MDEPSGRRIQGGTSRTAEAVCMIRACSFHEPDPHYHGDDWVAARLLPFFLRTGARLGLFRRVMRTRVVPEGLYEYVIARTKYVDAVFASVARDVSQILIFGAGYDSRAIRFAEVLRHARVFELDAPSPQADKTRGLELRKLPVPANLVFVPVDFETEAPAAKLAAAGFLRGQPTLCLLEGLTMYLEPKAVDETFRLIADAVGPGSTLVFDYAHASVLRREHTRYGEERILSSMVKTGEAWRFGIETGRVAAFLAAYGFEPVDEATADTLETRYFADEGGRIVGRVNGTQAIVTARTPSGPHRAPSTARSTGPGSARAEGRWFR